MELFYKNKIHPGLYNKMQEGFTFQCFGCWKMDCLTAEMARLTGIVKGVEMRMIKETDEIENDDWERDRKEQCNDKKERGSKLRIGRQIARKPNGDRTTENTICRKVTGEKVAVEKEGGTLTGTGQERSVTGGKSNGRKEVRVDVSKGSSIMTR